MRYYRLLCLALLVVLALMVLDDLRRAQARTDENRRASRDFFEIERLKTQALKDKLECERRLAIVSNASLVLWEVHSLDQAPGPMSIEQAESLCESVGSHSTFRIGTELVGYSIWNDLKGRPELGCRYVRSP